MVLAHPIHCGETSGAAESGNIGYVPGYDAVVRCNANACSPEAMPPLSVTILKLLRRTRTADDCGVGTLDGNESEYVESALAGIDAGKANCETWVGTGDIVFVGRKGMIVRNEDLNCFVGNADGFESLIHNLIRAEARICGIAPDQINWDYRTNVGDGGRDVMILAGSSHPERKYIPSKKSIWSVKSGRNGLEPSTLNTEVRSHPKVITHLQQGGTYICCIAPASSNNERGELLKKRGELAEAFGFAAEQIHFIFRDTLTAWLNDHLGLITVHLPHLPLGWKSLDEWKRLDRNRNVSWVDFGDRAWLVTKISHHLLSQATNNVLHLAGWSGIGKTRTAMQACEDPLLSGTLYFPTYGSFAAECETHLIRNPTTCAAVVIDEVSLDEFSSLESRLSECHQRLRVITIGAGTNKSIGSRPSVIEVSLPDSSEEVTAVIQSADAQLTVEQAQNIAAWCDHDLRLALLLTEANRQDPGLAQQPITSVDEVWRRVMRLFEEEIGDPQTFRNYYEILSLCLEVGNQGELRNELEYLARYFGKPVTELDRVIAQACDCGLGHQKWGYFKASPRALARRVFERWGWASVQSQASEFISGLRPQMQLSFLERVKESDEITRKNAAESLVDWLNTQFPTYDILQLSDRETLWYSPKTGQPIIAICRCVRPEEHCFHYATLSTGIKSASGSRRRAR